MEFAQVPVPSCKGGPYEPKVASPRSETITRSILHALRGTIVVAPLGMRSIFTFLIDPAYSNFLPAPVLARTCPHVPGLARTCPYLPGLAPTCPPVPARTYHALPMYISHVYRRAR